MRSGAIAGVFLFVGLAIWRFTHPRGEPWGNRWGEPID